MIDPSERVAAFVSAALTHPPGDAFAALAMEVHRWQVAHDPVVASLAEGRIDHWHQIPAVPVDLFKDLPVGTVGRDEPAVVFRTSGTTGSGRGIHRMRSTRLYDLGSVAFANRMVPGRPDRVVALLEDPETAPDSSLSHMVASFSDTATWHVTGGDLDEASLDASLKASTAPVFLASTAFALAQWLDGAPDPLPPGSVVMVTGGFKGRIHRLDGSQLYAAVRHQLCPARLVTEYGMTELSSQLWGTPALPYRPPPWLRVVAVDPDGRVLPTGTAGQLRMYDLCNVDSTLGIETMDEGRVLPSGAVILLGRIRGAPARGCSLTVEEAWGQ